MSKSYLLHLKTIAISHRESKWIIWYPRVNAWKIISTSIRTKQRLHSPQNIWESSKQKKRDGNAEIIILFHPIGNTVLNGVPQNVSIDAVFQTLFHESLLLFFCLWKFREDADVTGLVDLVDSWKGNHVLCEWNHRQKLVTGRSEKNSKIVFEWRAYRW